MAVHKFVELRELLFCIRQKAQHGGLESYGDASRASIGLRKAGLQKFGGHVSRD